MPSRIGWAGDRLVRCLCVVKNQYGIIIVNNVKTVNCSNLALHVTD